VGIEQFVQTLREIGFRGPLNIEREAENQQERIRDIRDAVGLLRRLGAPAA
jgi:sugar phosphate isomerase/epimerase